MSVRDAPPQKATNNRHIPPEILEMILSNLPVKSLLRFSSISKPLNSLIFGQDFVKKHRRQRIALNHSHDPYDLSHLSSCPVSAVLPESSKADAAAIVSPFKHPVSMKAFCDELWCVEEAVTNSLFLWNPSMRACSKLPTPSTQFYAIDLYNYYNPFRRAPYEYVYGLGYDSVGDDYKILKLGLDIYNKPRVAELYSLRSDSWKEIKNFQGDGTLYCYNIRSNLGLFVAGALHWVVNRPNYDTFVSFDLSTHEYREVGFPKLDRATDTLTSLVETVAMRGKLCLSVYYDMSCRFVFWVMEDYGVVESWTKKLDISFPDVPYRFGWSSTVVLRLLYSDDNGGILISRPSWLEKKIL